MRGGGQRNVDCTSVCGTPWAPLKWKPITPLCRVAIQRPVMANAAQKQPGTRTTGAAGGIAHNLGESGRVGRGVQGQRVWTGRVPTAPWRGKRSLCPAPRLFPQPGRRAHAGVARTRDLDQPMGDRGGDGARPLRGKHGHVTASPRPGSVNRHQRLLEPGLRRLRPCWRRGGAPHGARLRRARLPSPKLKCNPAQNETGLAWRGCERASRGDFEAASQASVYPCMKRVYQCRPCLSGLM